MKVKLSDKIIAATIQIGARQGIENISIKSIGDQCGVSSAAMYYHFKNKYDLLYKSTFYVVKQLSTVINKTVIPDLCYGDNYKRILKAISKYDLTHPAESIFYNRMLIVPSMSLEQADLDEIVSYCPLHAFLDEGQRNGHIINLPNIITMAYYPLCTFLMQYIIREATPSDDLLGSFIETLWKAISHENTVKPHNTAATHISA